MPVNPVRGAAMLAVAAAALSASACVSATDPGAAAPGLIFSDVTYPNRLNPNMEYRINFDRDDIEILRPVEAKAKSHWLFFLVSWGDSGYTELMDQVRAQGGDGLMNVTVDTKFNNWMLLYANIETRLSGTAYRYRRTGDPTPAPAAP